MGKMKVMVLVVLSGESNCVAFCGSIMKTMDYFRSSQTDAPDGSLPGDWSRMDAYTDQALELLAFGHLYF